MPPTRKQAPGRVMTKSARDAVIQTEPHESASSSPSHSSSSSMVKDNKQHKGIRASATEGVKNKATSTNNTDDTNDITVDKTQDSSDELNNHSRRKRKSFHHQEKSPETTIYPTSVDSFMEEIMQRLKNNGYDGSSSSADVVEDYIQHFEMSLKSKNKLLMEENESLTKENERLRAEASELSNRKLQATGDKDKRRTSSQTHDDVVAKLQQENKSLKSKLRQLGTSNQPEESYCVNQKTSESELRKQLETYHALQRTVFKFFNIDITSDPNDSNILTFEVENKSKKCHFVFRLHFDEADSEIHYTPLEIDFQKDTFPPVPPYLKESIYFDTKELPVFITKIMDLTRDQDTEQKGDAHRRERLKKETTKENT